MSHHGTKGSVAYDTFAFLQGIDARVCTNETSGVSGYRTILRPLAQLQALRQSSS